TLKDGEFDAVVFLGDWKFLSTWAALVYLRHKPCFFWSHGILNRRKSLNNYIKLKFFKLFRCGGFLYDNRAKNILLERGYNKPLTVIYNSLDYNQQMRVLAKNNVGFNSADLFPLKAPYVIFSGRLVPERQLELLFDSVRSLKEDGIILNVLIVGN